MLARLKPAGELLLADATSDATLEQVVNFYRIARSHARSRSQSPPGYQQISILPVQWHYQPSPNSWNAEGTVSQMPSMPYFLFRNQKPQSKS